MAVQCLDSAAPIFVFPEKIKAARHILIKPNVGYAAKPPVIVRMAFLRSVIEQVLALRADSYITIVEGVCTKVAAAQVFRVTGLSALASERVRVVDAETLALSEYAHIHTGKPFRFKSLLAPTLLNEVDARISIAPLKRTTLNDKPLISATIKNLFGLLPREKYHARSPHARGQLHRPNVHQVICDVYRTIGTRFDFGIVDAHEKFISRGWEPDKGDAVPVGKVLCNEDLIELDCAACEAGGETKCDYLKMLEAGSKSKWVGLTHSPTHLLTDFVHDPYGTRTRV